MQNIFMLLLVKGLMIGSIYALISLGFNVIYRTTGVLNFAQGEFVMMGGVVASWAFHTLQWPLWVALLTGMLAAGVGGALLHQLAIRPVKNTGAITYIIITVGASIVLQSLFSMIWGTDPYHLPPLREGGWRLAGVPVTGQGVLVLIGAACSMILLYAFFRWTRTGRAMKACSENRMAARLCGVNPQRMGQLSFVLSAMLGGIAGILLTPMLSMSFNSGTMLGLKGFSAAIIGGLGNPVGGVIGGVLLGLLEQYGCWVSSIYKETLALAMVLVILLVRPRGLLTR
jgi:branched-chain amino acid transport system permease protein